MAAPSTTAQATAAPVENRLYHLEGRLTDPDLSIIFLPHVIVILSLAFLTF